MLITKHKQRSKQGGGNRLWFRERKNPQQHLHNFCKAVQEATFDHVFKLCLGKGGGKRIGRAYTVDRRVGQPLSLGFHLFVLSNAGMYVVSWAFICVS